MSSRSSSSHDHRQPARIHDDVTRALRIPAVALALGAGIGVVDLEAFERATETAASCSWLSSENGIVTCSSDSAHQALRHLVGAHAHEACRLLSGDPATGMWKCAPPAPIQP
jgi:hypothetical protein